MVNANPQKMKEWIRGFSESTKLLMVLRWVYGFITPRKGHAAFEVLFQELLGSYRLPEVDLGAARGEVQWILDKTPQEELYRGVARAHLGYSKTKGPRKSALAERLAGIIPSLESNAWAAALLWAQVEETRRLHPGGYKLPFEVPFLANMFPELAKFGAPLPKGELWEEVEEHLGRCAVAQMARVGYHFPATPQGDAITQGVQSRLKDLVKAKFDGLEKGFPSVQKEALAMWGTVVTAAEPSPPKRKAPQALRSGSLVQWEKEIRFLFSLGQEVVKPPEVDRIKRVLLARKADPVLYGQPKPRNPLQEAIVLAFEAYREVAPKFQMVDSPSPLLGGVEDLMGYTIEFFEEHDGDSLESAHFDAPPPEWKALEADGEKAVITLVSHQWKETA